MTSSIRTREAVLQHYCVTINAGMAGTYALLLRGGNFGNAQTGNLMELMIDITQGDFREILFRLGAFLIFCFALVLSTVLSRTKNLEMRRVTLAGEVLCAVIAAFIPLRAPAVLALYPIFFMAAFQWGTFTGADGISSATVFITNNTRQTVIGLTEYMIDHDPVSLKKFRFYGRTLLSFLLGALGGALITPAFGPIAALFFLIPLGMAYLLTLQGEKAFKQTNCQTGEP